MKRKATRPSQPSNDIMFEGLCMADTMMMIKTPIKGRVEKNLRIFYSISLHNVQV